MKPKWEICGRCTGDGFTLRYADDDPYGDFDSPVEVGCHKCGGSGKVRFKTDDEKFEEREERKLACYEDGIYPGSDSWNEYMS